MLVPALMPRSKPFERGILWWSGKSIDSAVTCVIWLIQQSAILFYEIVPKSADNFLKMSLMVSSFLFPDGAWIQVIH
jgi:hypothetical protein